MAKATGTMPKKAPGKRKVANINIERAGNGFTVHHRMEPNMNRKPGGGLMPMDGDESPAPSVFNKRSAMMAHVGNLAGQMQEPEPGEAGETGEPA